MSLGVESLNKGFLLHEHSVYPSRNVIINPIGEQRIEPKAMQVLLILASRPSVVIPRNEFMEQVWPGIEIGEEVLTRCISLLRSALKENNQHNYIETVPKSGYRLVAPVKALNVSEYVEADTNSSRNLVSIMGGLTLAITVIIIAFAAYFYKPADPIQAVKNPSIAVLPFVNMSNDSAQDYFSDGMAEEILNLLAKIPQLDVIARTSSFSFKGKDDTINEIAKKLNVSYVMEGSVRKSGAKIRITAQLIDAATDMHIWSETYDREIADIFSIQDEISTAIVKELKSRLGIEIKLEARTMAAINLEAHNEYMKGMFFVEKLTYDDLNTALQHFEKAIAIDTDYAPAWMGKARAHLLSSEFNYGVESIENVIKSARPAAEKALQLDPLLAEAQAIMGQVAETQVFREGWEKSERNYEKAFAYYNKAIELNPNYAEAYIWLSKVDKINRFELLEKAVQLDPMNLQVNREYGRLLVKTRRFDKATELAIHMLDIDNSSHLPYELLKTISWAEGKAEEGLLYAEKQTQLNQAIVPAWGLWKQLRQYGFKDKAIEHFKLYNDQSEIDAPYEDGILFEWLKTYMEKDFEQHLLIARKMFTRGEVDVIAFFRNGQAELYAGNCSEAIEFFIKNNPNAEHYYKVYCYQQIGDFESANKAIDDWRKNYNALIDAGRDNIESFAAQIAFAESDIDKMVELLNTLQQRETDSILNFEYNHLPMYQKLREHSRWPSLLAESDKRAAKVREEYLRLADQDVEAVARAHTSKQSIPNIEISVATEILEDYVGVYVLTPTFSVTVTLENGYLILQGTNQSKSKVLPESETKFFASTSIDKFSFQRDENGAVVSMIEHDNNFDQLYKKVKILEKSP